MFLTIGLILGWCARVTYEKKKEKIKGFFKPKKKD
jgi:hypothetical protein